MENPSFLFKPIPRGADLTEDDLKLIVDDFVVVRNWGLCRPGWTMPRCGINCCKHSSAALVAVLCRNDADRGCAVGS